ncbi:MAG: hypothetical protein IKZ12_06930 [Alistipes sp.]|nr:hypothetical protein [Alistipes sp.]
MKKVLLSIGIVLFVVNGLFGLLLSGYDTFNLVFTSMVIVTTTLLLYLLCTIKMKDGFIIGLGFMFALFGIVGYILGLVSGQEVQDNGYVIAVIALAAIEAISLVICHITSKSIK